MVERFTITEGWEFGGRIVGVSAPAVRAIGRYLNTAGIMPDSDRTRSPKPQIELPHAVVILLAMLTTGQQTEAAREVYFAWNLPAATPLGRLRDDLTSLGVQLPAADDEVRFGRDIISALINLTARSEGLPWVTTAIDAVIVWHGSDRAALRLHDGDLIEFETKRNRYHRLTENNYGAHPTSEAYKTLRRSVQAEVSSLTLAAFGRVVWRSRLAVARLAETGIKHAIPVQQTLDALTPKPEPTLPDPSLDGDQAGFSPEAAEADGEPPPPASAKSTRSAILQPEVAPQAQGYSVPDQDGSEDQRSGHSQSGEPHVPRPFAERRKRARPYPPYAAVA